MLKTHLASGWAVGTALKRGREQDRRKRGRGPSSVSSQVRLRACCVTQPESGTQARRATWGARCIRLAGWRKRWPGGRGLSCF
jgi:hypothetical protein